jgi:putative hydrolase of the HAD superfamily
MSIKNIIFDFGGVIYDIDFHAAAKAFRETGVEDFEKLYSQFSQDKLFDMLETGKITPQKFRDEFRKGTGLNIADKQIDDAWNALLIGFVDRRIQLLKKIANQYNIYLLSNSNIIHYWKYRDEFEQRTGMKIFDELFQKAYFSHNIGLRKPDREIFDFLLQEQKLNAEETLFIDDTEMHTRAAQSVGIQSRFLQLQRGEDMCDLFDNEGILRPGWDS